MLYIGSHVSFGKDAFRGSVKEALSYNANAFMFYTGAPQNTVRKPIDEENTLDGKKLMEENNISMDNVICHAPYIINLANKEKIDSYNFSISFLKEELNRCNKMGVKYIVVHPGNYLKTDLDIALSNISEALNEVLDNDNNVMVLLETMAGKGTECGRNTLELKKIIDNVIYQNKIGVCLDTCHLNDSGIDISKFDTYLDEFDKIIGINKIKCIHVNDSQNMIGSHKDRHANIGLGTIGFNNLINVLYNPRLDNITKILETPYMGEYPPYKFEIEEIRGKAFNENLINDVNDYYKNL